MRSDPPVATAIVAVHNEERHIAECLQSLRAQTYRPLEILVADDGSTDRTCEIATAFAGVRVLRRPHAGKATAVNHAAREAGGEVLLFLDGDMFFDRGYVAAMVQPIVDGLAVGTCHGSELVANPGNLWSRCWQIKAGLPPDTRLRLTADDLSAGSRVFRAVRRNEFLRVGGFDDTGYDDDQTLFAKLQTGAMFVPTAVCYHYNLENLGEVFSHGVWGGKTIHFKFGPRALVRYSLPWSLAAAAGLALRLRSAALLPYTVVNEAGVFWGVLRRTLKLDTTLAR